MKFKIRDTQRGQSLVLVALMLVAFLGILALAIDGGTLLSNRRAAQNSADAGALAGARTLCLTHDTGQAEFMASQYVVNHGNGGQAAQADASLDDRTVTVTATITMDTAFAHFIGQDTLVAQASAAAGCFPPTSGESILPVAWACRPPLPGLPSDSEDCQEDYVTMDELDFLLNNPPSPGTIHPELYIVMDSASTFDDLSQICAPDGWLLCDLDGDGDDDLIANGGRSWLDLDGSGGGASSLIDWIDGGFTGEIYAHTWLGGQNGVANSVFQAVGDVVGTFALLPIFDEICDNYPDPACAGQMHGQDTIVYTSGSNYYYHVIGFAVFYIACVDAPGVPGPECPGHRVATDLGVIPNNTKTIEGYFVTGFVPGLGGGPGGGGVDTGAYTLYLTR